MKVNKIFLSTALALTGLCASAQTAPVQEETEYVFEPTWYIQGQVGGQETLGEAPFGKLAAFNAQVALGYQFSPAFGARLVLNSWTSRAASEYDKNTYKWKWKYLAPTVNVTADLVTLLGGFNPERVVSAGLFAGVGANVGYSNDEAQRANTAIKTYLYGDKASAQPNALGHLWDGTKVRFVGQFGVFCDFRLTENLKLGLELQANVLPDTYNSKDANNADWYFNGLVGVKYSFGSGYTTRKRQAPAYAAGEPQVVEKIVEVPVERVVIKEVIKEVPGPIQHDIFFKISTTKVTKDEMFKVAEISRYLKENPEATAKITGYADKGTGSLALNLRLAAQRADAVKDCLVKDFGIDPSRISTASMGEDEYQPYNLPQLNRVAIVIAK